MKICFWSAIMLLVLLPAGWPQIREISPPASVIHEGIPPVPYDLGRETSPYRSSVGSSLIGWDPEKPQVLVSSNCFNDKCAGRVEGPGSPFKSLLQLPNWYRDISYEPGGKFLIYTKPVDENFQDQIYRYDLSTKETTLLTDGKSRNRYPIFSSSGKLLAYSSNRRNGRDMDVYVVDPLKPDSTRMLAKLDGEDWALFDWSPDDRKVILSDYKSVNETYLWIFDIETGRKTLLTPPSGSDQIFNGSYAVLPEGREGHLLHHGPQQRVSPVSLSGSGQQALRFPRREHQVGHR